MELCFQNVFIAFFAVIFHLVSAHEDHAFSTENGWSILHQNNVFNNPDYDSKLLNRSSFPPDFTFGFGSSAYQIEGAWNVDGKGPSIWDNFTHTYPERIADKSNGDFATKSYKKYKEDIDMIKAMNGDSYRFSISWSRIFPNGKFDKGRGVNKKGVDYYNNLINEVISNDLEPFVTMFHFDLPQALEDEYDGVLDGDNFRQDFVAYANFLFEIFGDRVKQWTTINEPFTYVKFGYDDGYWPPNRCSQWINENCRYGHSGYEPYIAAHNMLLAHGDVYHLYRTKYKDTQKGMVGLTLLGIWPLPYRDVEADRIACKRYLEFTFGWFFNPITYGDYPEVMRKYVKERLPVFTAKQFKWLRGATDFFGLNYYTAIYVKDISSPTKNETYQSLGKDVHVGLSFIDINGNRPGEKLGIRWHHSYPKGIWNYLHFIKDQYKNPLIFIHENGASEKVIPDETLEMSIYDSFRSKFHFEHLSYLKKAIDDGVRVKRYYAWALLDNFEWCYGYTIRFASIHIDRITFARYPKASALWFHYFLRKFHD